MADNDPMMAIDSNQESVAVPNYNMMGYQSMMAGYDNGYGNGYGGASRPNYANFAHRAGGVAAGSQSAGNSGNSASANNGANGGAAGNGGNDYDYMAASDASNRQISNGIGVSGYGGGYGGNAGYGGGYGGFNGGSGAGARFGGGSGYGGGGGYTPVNVLGSSYGSVCGDEGLSPALVLGTLVGSAVAFAILFRQVTLSRKKKRDFPDDDDSFGFDGVVGWLGDLAWNGLEEFEEKIDRIADGQDTTDDSWISRIYNQFVGEYGEVDNALDESDMDGLEPPLLDEKWGLSAALNNKTTTEESDKDDTISRTKRDVDDNTVDEEFYDEDIPMELTKGEEKCRVDMWRCLSKVVEGSLHYMDNPDGLMGLAKKTMFKMAFHGGLSNIWSGVMAIPEARQVKRCMNTHEECMAYEILNREVSDSLDPQDPEFQQIQDKMRENLSSTKKRRIMVNPEFVQSLDKSDGAEQYDYDQVEEDADY